ncbi:DUF1338 domain-containing protein [Opacimonas viscosa]|uniref:2-oxoadipate dioxygenase/decarboxylase n=1 Tax=Opacimonas viscosa TaxID=2961944 RepID=A0AA42BLV5_9ALTE|nr:DUF1338 domain-containing protein [Opacimonas viscosa]MCP3429278.1 DUF1338 domain-containing protein [Opacimonas viscosa]
MHTQIESLFAGLWEDYLTITPSAMQIHKLIQAEDEQANIVNDHIALRTFALPGMRVTDLAEHFVQLGYRQAGEYDFSSKKLNAFHYEHSDENQPKVFISELRVDELSARAQAIIHNLTKTLPSDLAQQTDFLYSGTHWAISYEDYTQLLAESEYAAWLAAWGFRANHFTVSINHLQKITELTQMNALLQDHGFVLNQSGGVIKGGEDVCLAQSATMADHALVKFSDLEKNIPSCFYEFAQRYPLNNGKLYHGFVAASADKIFESTNVN